MKQSRRQSERRPVVVDENPVVFTNTECAVCGEEGYDYLPPGSPDPSVGDPSRCRFSRISPNRWGGWGWRSPPSEAEAESKHVAHALRTLAAEPSKTPHLYFWRRRQESKALRKAKP